MLVRVPMEALACAALLLTASACELEAPVLPCDESDPACSPALPCGEGTIPSGGSCVADAGAVLSCGAGTIREGDLCIADPSKGLRCGRGTVAASGTCVPSRDACGPGTRLAGESCVVADVACGPDTHLENGHCVGDAPNCGPGTHLVGAACLPDGTLACGPGTRRDGNLCVPVEISCGAGTVLVGDVCVSSVTCGPGTVLHDGTCVPSSGAVYDVRFAARTFPGDGYTKVMVLALGRDATGAPSNETVRVRLSRPSAGAFTVSELQLSELGALTYFVPCSTALDPNCAGPLQAELVRPSAPDDVIARSEVVEIVPPIGVGSIANCLQAPRALFFDGDGFIFRGQQLVTDAAWGGFALLGYSGSNTTDVTNHVSINVTPSRSGQGSWWHLDFGTDKIPADMAVQVYRNAERFAFAPPGRPGIDIGGDGRGCNSILGNYQVHALRVEGGVLQEFLASFEQFCETRPTNVLRGCVRYTR